DSEDARVVIEAGRVDEQAVRRLFKVQFRRDGVVVGRAGVAVLDRPLLHECNCHLELLSSPARDPMGVVSRGAAFPGTQPATPRASLILVISSVSLGLTPVFALATCSATPITSS